MPNATGWTELMNGNMVDAVYVLYDSSMQGMGLPVVILFLITQAMIYAKTKHVALMWSVGIIFVSMYALTKYMEPLALKIMFVLLVFELGAVIYSAFFSKVQTY